MGILIVDNERVVKEYKDVHLKLKTIFENLIYPQNSQCSSHGPPLTDLEFSKPKISTWPLLNDHNKAITTKSRPLPCEFTINRLVPYS